MSGSATGRKHELSAATLWGGSHPLVGNTGFASESAPLAQVIHWHATLPPSLRGTAWANGRSFSSPSDQRIAYSEIGLALLVN